MFCKLYIYLPVLFCSLKNIIDICLNLYKINWATVLCGAVSLVIFVLVKELINERYKAKMFMPIPMELILVNKYLEYLEN